MTITTTDEAAKRVGVSTRTLFRWIADGQIPAPEKLKIAGQGIWNWKKKDIQRALRCKEQMKPGRKPVRSK